MWKNERKKTELVIIDSQLRLIKDAMVFAERENNTVWFNVLVRKQLELSRRKNELISELTIPIDSIPDHFRVDSQLSEELKPNHFLISIAGFLFSDKIRETALGCLEERFHNNCVASGKITAQLYLLRDILESVYPILKSTDSKQFFFPLIQFFVFVSQLIGTIIVYGSAMFAFLGYLLTLIMLVTFLVILGFSHPSTNKVYYEPCKVSAAYYDSLQLRKDLRKYQNSEEINFSHKTIVQSIYNSPIDNCIVSR